MAKSNGKMNSCDTTGWASAAVLVGAAYALQHNGVLFSNVILWPWVLIALGIVTIIYNKS